MGRRQFEEDEPPAPNRTFRITDAQRRQIADALRHIDEARRAVERQHNAENRTIVRELRASADAIFDVLNELEEAD